MSLRGRLAGAALAGALATSAFAGGPLYTFDPENRIPYAWAMASWPGGQVPIYTDLGTLGILSNVQANGLVAGAAAQWSSVPTSSFRATVAGDFSAIGVGDVDDTSITSVIGAYNGGGIDVVYDSDGSILSDYFGVPPTSVLGITDIEYVGIGTPEIAEAWMVLSGPGVRADDPDGIGFAGVVTHEMGHALNLAHTQANGAAVNLGDPPHPGGCTAPWSGGPNDSQVETMYPFITPEPTGTGAAMATVDRLDDRAALSDIYPAPGWPSNTGTISGDILDADGNPITGVNVIARNAADPFNDVDSYISGQVSKGQAGPDGSFVMNGLTPGASYLLYVDGLLAGAFSVPTMPVLPGSEEYWNGAMESGNGETDQRCQWTPIVATAGSPVTVQISLNRFPGAPTLITSPNLSFQTVPTDITPDGAFVVGGEGTLDVPIFRWDVNAGSVKTIGGTMTGGASISDDGSTIAANFVDTDGVNKAAIHTDFGWTILPAVPGAVACNNSSSGPMVTSAYDISGDGSTVVGLSFGAGGCSTSTIRGFKWTAAGGTVALPKFDAPTRAGRANAVNYDGSVIAGWDDNVVGVRRGAQWRNGVVSLIKENNQAVGEALDVSGDGQYVVGSSNSFSSYNAWLWSSTTGIHNLGTLSSQTSAIASAVDADAGVIVGRSQDLNAGTTTPTIWTSALHWTDLNAFLSVQGVNTSGITLAIGTAISADGRTFTGYGTSRYGYLGWIVKTPTSIVCHADPGNPSAVSTIIVSFPGDLNTHLGHGDTLGPCPCLDADGDGYTTCAGDCNDGNAAVHPGAAETCNGIDDDCNGVVDDVPVPSGRPTLAVANASGATQLSWSGVGGATAYDVFGGDLTELRQLAGSWASLTQSGCAINDLAATTFAAGNDVPAPGEGRWYLVRPVNCGGAGSYDDADTHQSGSRDAGIQSSPSACP